MVANSIESNKSCVSRKKLNVNETKQEETTNKKKTAGLLDVILELRSSKLTSLEPQMILAGNQVSKENPYISLLGYYTIFMFFLSLRFIYSYFKPLEFLSRYSFSRYSVTRYSLLRYSV